MPTQDDAANAKYPRIRVKHLLVYSSIFIAVPIFTFLIGRTLDSLLHLPRFPSFPINILLGSAVFFPGLAVGIKATRTLFRKGEGLPWGELNERSQTKRLVTHGIYAYTRNPMVLGYSLLPCGMGIMFQSPSMTMLITAIVLVASAWVAKTREEPSLEKRFGETYLDYKRRTPFLIPHPRSLRLDLARRLLTTTLDGNVNRAIRVRRVQLVFYSLSLLALSLLAVLALTAQPISILVQKWTIGAAFGAICILGIVAGVSPARCNQLFLHLPMTANRHREESPPRGKTRPSFIGHHPDCGSYSPHVLCIGDRVCCAGCIGLVVGASIALIGTGAYVLLPSLPAPLAPVLFWSGLVGVTLGLFQYELFMNKASIHFSLNVVFVVGAFLLLIGSTEMNGSLLTSVYFLLVVLFLIMVRTTLSRLEHERICTVCRSESCSMK